MKYMHICEYAMPNAIGITAHSYRMDEVNLHGHDFYEFEYISSGSGTHYLNHTQYKISPGMFVCLGPNDFHHYEATDVCMRNLIVVLPHTAEPIRKLIEEQSFPLCGYLPEDRRAHTEQLYDALEQNYKAKTAYHDTRLTAYTLLLLSEYFEFANCRSTKAEAWGAYKHVETALHYLIDHSAESISLNKIAQQINISPSHLSSIFSEYVGCCFTEYLTKTRLKNACVLLECSTLPVLEIASRTGFGSISTMNRAFKRYLASSPSEYRRKKRSI